MDFKLPKREDFSLESLGSALSLSNLPWFLSCTRNYRRVWVRPASQELVHELPSRRLLQALAKSLSRDNSPFSGCLQPTNAGDSGAGAAASDCTPVAFCPSVGFAAVMASASNAYTVSIVPPTEHFRSTNMIQPLLLL